jgi:hypothetical protein
MLILSWWFMPWEIFPAAPALQDDRVLVSIGIESILVI